MNIKKENRYFNIVQYEQEAAYLREMHKQGWKVVKVTFPGHYTFEACTPQDVVYQLDYNQEGIQHKEEYTRMFADCGWEYLFDFVGYSYFRKPAAEMNGEEEIFCDDESRLEMMRRIFAGRLLPLLVLFCCVIVPGLIRFGHDAQAPVWVAILYSVIACVYIGVFA